jgi:tetratricopeptide (TPR) repeat protein
MTGLLLNRLLSVNERRITAKVRSRILCSIGAVIIVCCAWRSAPQCEIWQNNRTLWTHTLSINPECFIANFNLGNYYARKKDCETALKYYDVANRLEKNLDYAKAAAVNCLMELGRIEEAHALRSTM